MSLQSKEENHSKSGSIYLLTLLHLTLGIFQPVVKFSLYVCTVVCIPGYTEVI